MTEDSQSPNDHSGHSAADSSFCHRHAGLAANNPGLQKLVMGIFGLPAGLAMVMVTGSELYTGNAVLLTMALLEGKATLKQLLSNWIISYIRNIGGAALVVSVLINGGNFAGATAPIASTMARCNLTWSGAVAWDWLQLAGVYGYIHGHGL